MIEPALVAQIEAVERDAWLDIYTAAPPPIRSALGIVGRRVDDGALLICRAIDHLQFNRFGYLGFAAPARAEAVDAALADFDAAGVKNWIVHVAQGADSLDCLCAARGLTPHPRTWAKFIRDDRAAPAAATTLAVREVGADEGRAFGAAAAAGFGMPPVVGEWLAALVGRPRWHCFVGFDGDTPGSAGALFIDGTCGWLGIGATVGSHRQRGAQSAILAARINAAIALGCSVLTTETGIPHSGEAAPSYANIQRAGFAVAYPRPNLQRAQAAVA
jgi:hypothetical protein